MMKKSSCKEINRIMIAGMTSGSGKTTLTCAFLRCLQKRGLDPRSFKCGPDYIDPMFHGKVLGIESRNLDMFFMGEERLRKTLSKAEGRYAVIEGVMGVYDGNDPSSAAGSCYEVAAVTSTPIVLTVNAGGVGRTVISMIMGVLSDDVHSLIKGIILNNMSGGYYKMLLPELEKSIGGIRPDVKILGAFPKTKGIDFESRHLGLKLPGKSDDTLGRIEYAAEVFDENIDVDAMIGLMRSAPDITAQNMTDTYENASAVCSGSLSGPGFSGTDLTLAVALDDAFCFYYRDNIEMFEERGVKVKYFSPLDDECVPEDADGILIGGGYPELYLDRLCANKSMMTSLKELICSGIPSLAECGGFMYLGRAVEDADGKVYETVGAYEGISKFTGRSVRFGYMLILDADVPDSLVKCMKGLKGHEFHYYDSDMNGDACTAKKPFRDTQWKCIMDQNNGIWGFPHFYYGSAPAFVDAFIVRMREVRDGKLK